MFELLKKIEAKKIVTLIIIMLLLFASKALSIVVLEDNFNINPITANWQISYENAKNWEYEIFDSNLIAKRIDPVIINQGDGGSWSSVKLSQLIPPLENFDIHFNLSWDSENKNEPMNKLLVALYDKNNQIIAQVGYGDAWVGHRGSKYLQINSSGGLINGYDKLPHKESLSFRISRNNGNINIFCNGQDAYSGYNHEYLCKISVIFGFYPYKNYSVEAILGNLFADSIKVEGNLETIPENEKIVLIDGISFDRTAQCSFKECPDRDSYLNQTFSELFTDEMNKNNLLGEIYPFEWSGDMVTHGENLKTKFRTWFNKEVCKEGEECYVSFLSHSWGTIIMSDFIASMIENSSIKIRTIVTFGSPVTGSQIAFFKEPFWETAITKVTSTSNYIALKPSKWINIVHPNDPIAWDILNSWYGIFYFKVRGVENIQHNAQLSHKGRLSETFPVSNSEFDYKYLGTTLLRLYNVGAKQALNIIVGSWTNDSTPTFDAHFNGYIQDETDRTRLIKYITSRLPKTNNENQTNWSTPAIQILDQEIYKPETGEGCLIMYNNFKAGTYSNFTTFSNNYSRCKKYNDELTSFSYLAMPSLPANRSECLLLSMLIHGDTIESGLSSHYQDVNETHPLYDVIETATKKQFVIGYVDNDNKSYFKPNDEITRVEALKIIFKVFQLDLLEDTHVEYKGREWSENLFSDVDSETWWYKYVKAAFLYEIMDGYGNENFGPNDKISRSQIVKIIFQTHQIAKDNNKSLGLYIEPEFENYYQSNNPPFGDLIVKKMINEKYQISANFSDIDGDSLYYYWIVDRGNLESTEVNSCINWYPDIINKSEYFTVKVIVQDGKGLLGYDEKTIKTNYSDLNSVIIILKVLAGNQIPYKYGVDLDYNDNSKLDIEDAIILLQNNAQM